MIFIGIDAGSRAIKIALLDGDAQRVLATGRVDQGVHQEQLAMDLLDSLLAEQQLTRDDIAYTVATGAGRDNIDLAEATITEITCHARGVHKLTPEAKTVIEIGGQDSKFLHLNGDGAVLDFAMNDRCAAGTGRFLEMVADRLDVPLDSLGELAGGSDSPAIISSMCVVFAETEIVGLLARGISAADIAAGVQRATVARVCAMGGRRIASPLVLTGGVAMIPGMAEAMEHTMDMPVITSPQPQFTGAIGAALLAAARSGQ